MKKKWQAMNWGQKNFLLVIVLLFAGWIIYANTVSVTFALAAECEALERRADSAAHIDTDILRLEQELAALNTISGEEASVSHEELLDVVSGYCAGKELQLRDYPNALRYTRDEWEVETHRITVEGSYIALVLFLEHLRNAGKGKIVSADFFTRVDNKTKKRSLQATVYVQCITTVRP